METETEGKEVVAEEVTNAQPKTTEELEALKAEIQKAQAEAAKWKAEHDKQQKAAMELGKKAKDIQTIQAEIAQIKEDQKYGFSVVAEALDEQSHSREGYEEQPKPKTSYKERLEANKPKVIDPKVTAEAEHIKEVAEEIAAIQKRLNVDFKEADDDRVYIQFALGNYDKALKIAKGIESKMLEEKKPVDDKDKLLAELQAKVDKYEKKETLKEKGELISEKGQPSGAALSDLEFKKKFAAGDLPVNKENVDRLNKINKQ